MKSLTHWNTYKCVCGFEWNTFDDGPNVVTCSECGADTKPKESEKCCGADRALIVN